MKLTKGNYLGQESRSFPLDAEGLDAIQQNIMLTQTLGNIVGDKVILYGCERISTYNVSSGYVFLCTAYHPEGEVVYFEGGNISQGVYLKAETVGVYIEGSDYPEAYTVRSLAIGLGDEWYSWSEFKSMETWRAMVQHGATYIVDSDQALADWANAVEGNDYSVVLIREGTWNSSVGIDLEASGTKSIIGQQGSVLEFAAGVSPCIYCTEGYECSITGITVKAYGGTEDSYGVFTYCSNLNNTRIYLELNSSNDRGYGFKLCQNLTNCNAFIIRNHQSVSPSGFYQCSNINNCTSEISNNYSASGGTVILLCFGFNNCTKLVSCTATNFTYGFIGCRNLLMCTDKSSFMKYSNCYMTDDDTYPVGNTPEGGWNA